MLIWLVVSFSLLQQGNEEALVGQVRQQFRMNMHETDEAKVSACRGQQWQAGSGGRAAAGSRNAVQFNTGQDCCDHWHSLKCTACLLHASDSGTQRGVSCGGGVARKHWAAESMGTVLHS